jgi:SSS family solute:Na+ symporter
MGSLNLLDILVLLSYLLGITTIGSRFYHKNASMQEYLLGSKRMRWFPVALSIIAADTSAISYLGVPAWSFQHDLKLNQQIFTIVLAIPIVTWLFLPIYSRGNLYTAYQYLEERFDLRVRLLTSLLFLVVRGTHVAIVIYAPAMMMSEVMGVPLKFSILAMGLLTTFYTAMGGIKGVIWTDAIQVGTVLLGLTAVAVSVLGNISGGIGEVLSTGMAAGKFQLFDFSVNINKVDNFWALLVGGTVLNIQAMSTDQAVLQKFMTTKSIKETRRSLLFYGFIIIPMMTGLAILGVLLFVFYLQHPALKASLQNHDAVLPYYAANMLPHGLAGLVVASMFAGSMSTVSASLNALATSSVVDIYRRFVRRHQADEHYALASRWATFAWGLVATIGALYAGGLGELVISFAKIQSLIGGIILGVFLLGVLTKHVSSTSALLGSLIGLSVVLYVSLYSSVSLYWYCVVGCMGTLAGGWFWASAGMGRDSSVGNTENGNSEAAKREHGS